MRRIPVALSVCCIALALAFSPSAASASMRFLNQAALKMKVVSSDGSKVADKVVSYSIVRINGQWEVYWDEVIFMDFDGEIVPVLSHYSTREGTVAHVKVGKDFASFDIETGPTSIRVVCRQPDDYMGAIEVRAMAVYPDRTEEWHPTDKIILPSNVIGGITSLGEKPAN